MNQPTRLPPLEPPFTPALDALLTRMMPKRFPVPPLALFRTLGHNLPLAEAMQSLGSYLLGKKADPEAGLPTRERELVIQRVCARCGCEYEWGVHAGAYGARVGIPDEQLHATVHAAATDPVWAERDRLILRAVDELHDTSRLSPELWTELAARWSPSQLVELMVLSGWYHAIAYVANGAGVPLEPWAPRFPAAAQASPK